MYSLGDIAQQFGLELHGDPDREITGVGTLDTAGAGQISFLANRKYRSQLNTTRADAIILAAVDAEKSPVPVLISPNPYASYARVASLFDDSSTPEPGIHPSAVVHETAVLAEDVVVEANCVIGFGVKLGSAVVIGPGSVLEQGVVVGDHTVIHANVTLCRGVQIGRDGEIHSGVVIGADGFGLAFDDDQWVKVPQLGSVVVGDGVSIGANTTVDRGAIGDTVLEDGVQLDNQIQVAHNCRIGRNTAIAGCTGLAGSTEIGAGCLIGGAAIITGHLSICDGVTLLASATVTQSISKPGTYSSVLPVEESGRWNKMLARLRRLEDMAKRIRRLEAR